MSLMELDSRSTMTTVSGMLLGTALKPALRRTNCVGPAPVHRAAISSKPEMQLCSTASKASECWVMSVVIVGNDPQTSAVPTR